MPSKIFSNEIKEPTPVSPHEKVEFTHDMLRKLIIGTVLVSLLIGGASGAFFSAWVLGNENVQAWFQRNVLLQKNVSTSLAGDIAQKGTIKVEEESATIDVVKKVAPAVVSIIGKQDLSKLYDLTGPNGFPFDFFGFPFGTQQQAPLGKQQVSAGTGFIIGSDGLILTNKHVVSVSGETEYSVVMADGKQYDATIVDTDPTNDLAILRIEAKGLPTLDLGDSSSLQIGQTVIAIGYALGQYENTVTKGVISGLSRTITAGDNSGSSETLEDIIQTDAAINFGNSGGPLLNLAGQVIGVNTAISQQGQLIGFAIPVNQVKKAVDSVQKFGKIMRPYLGVRYVIINDAVAQQNELTVNYGALIIKGQDDSEPAIVPGSPADKAGLAADDIILEFNGQRIDQDHSLAKEIQKYNPGDEVTLKVLSKGKEKTIKVTLAEYKK